MYEVIKDPNGQHLTALFLNHSEKRTDERSRTNRVLTPNLEVMDGPLKGLSKMQHIDAFLDVAVARSRRWSWGRILRSWPLPLPDRVSWTPLWPGRSS
jgi:hypothetical protein